MTLDSGTIDGLKKVTPATLTTILLKMGLRSTWISGAMPLRPDQERIVCRAFTFRFVPAREDLATPAWERETTVSIRGRDVVESVL